MIEIYLYRPVTGSLTTTANIPVASKADLPRIVKLRDKHYAQVDRFGVQYVESEIFEIKPEGG